MHNTPACIENAGRSFSYDFRQKVEFCVKNQKRGLSESWFGRKLKI